MSKEETKQCQHKRVQDYTEICLDCGKNIYDINEEKHKVKEKESTPWYESDW